MNKDKVINDLLKRISNLEFEVERLEKDNKKFINTIKEVNKECNNLFNHLTKKDLDYKTRIDKAIEYINNCSLPTTTNEYILSPNHLIDILKGVNKE